MHRLLGLITAALTALIIGLAPIPSAQAAPVLTGTGALIRDTAPATTTDVGWRGGRGYRGGFRGGRGFHRGRGFYRPARFYRPYRPVYYRPYRPVYHGGYGYGARCFIRPARYVYTPYGVRFRPARRVCRY